MEFIKEILKKIEDNGFKAYIVGGYVRDDLLKIHSLDIDICTSAREKDLMWIFYNAKNVPKYGSVKLSNDKYNIDITTFRKEENLINGKPSSVTYIDNLEEDLGRRDFTINAMCYDSEFNLIDLVGGKRDLSNKIIRVIGNTKKKFDEDPLRILRALRFMTIYDFSLSKDIISYISEYPFKLSEISYNKRKYELDKIFASKNVFKFLNVLKKYNLEEYLGIKVKKIKRTGYSLGIWAQIEFDKEYPFTKIELENINKIRNIVNSKVLDKYTIYQNGNYVSTICASIMNKSVKSINNIYNKLTIKDRKDIDISSNEICEVLNIKPSKELGLILDDIEKQIIYGKIENKKENIISYLKKRSDKNARFKRKFTK